MASSIDAAAAGIRRAELQLSASASNLARSADPEAKAQAVQGDQVQLSGEPIDPVRDIVQLSTAKVQLEANVAVIKATREAERHLLDVIA